MSMDNVIVWNYGKMDLKVRNVPTEEDRRGFYCLDFVRVWYIINSR